MRRGKRRRAARPPSPLRLASPSPPSPCAIGRSDATPPSWTARAGRSIRPAQRWEQAVRLPWRRASAAARCAPEPQPLPPERQPALPSSPAFATCQRTAGQSSPSLHPVETARPCVWPPPWRRSPPRDGARVPPLRPASQLPRLRPAAVPPLGILLRVPAAERYVHAPGGPASRGPMASLTECCEPSAAVSTTEQALHSSKPDLTSNLPAQQSSPYHLRREKYHMICYECMIVILGEYRTYPLECTTTTTTLECTIWIIGWS